MANQSNIDANAIKIAELVDKARAELIQDLYKIGNEIDDAEVFVQAMLQLDVKGTLKSKLQNATNIYLEAHRQVLESTIGFAQVEGTVVTGLAQLNQEIFDDTLVNTIASHIRNEVVKGIQSGLTTTQIIQSVTQSSISNAQIETLVTTTLNDYSRTITNQMMDIAPANSKYVYIGPIDEKTRPECITYAAAGRLTKKEIESRGWSETLIRGGGFNCRHKWEIASSVGTSFHNKKKADKRLGNV